MTQPRNRYKGKSDKDASYKDGVGREVASKEAVGKDVAKGREISTELKLGGHYGKLTPFCIKDRCRSRMDSFAWKR